LNLSEIPRYTISVGGETAEIGTADELAIALDVLNGLHDREVLQQLEEHLGMLIEDPLSFRSVLKSLSPEDQVFLVDALAPTLTETLRDAHQLRDTFASLAHTEVETRIIEALSTEGLRSLIGTAEQLAEVVEWAYGECDELLLRKLGADYLESIMKNAWELSEVLANLTPDAQQFLLDAVGRDKLKGYVRDGRDLAYLLRALPGTLSTGLINAIVPQELRALVGNRADWQYLWQRLEPAEADLLEEKLEVMRGAS